MELALVSTETPDALGEQGGVVVIEKVKVLMGELTFPIAMLVPM